MPLYTFRCRDCDHDREVMTDLATADGLELVCTSCGGSMTRAPVLALSVIGPAIAAHRNARQEKAEEMFRPCGHKYHCRCGVRLTDPNPFKREIRKAHGFVEED